MRNLLHIREDATSIALKLNKNEELCGKQKLVSLVFDSISDCFYAATSDCRILCIEKSSYEVIIDFSLIENGILPELDVVVGMEYVLEQEGLLLAMAAGELLLFTPTSLEVEVVGVLEGGLVAMAWAPNGEVVAFVTGKGKLLLMTNDWEVLAEVELNQEINSIVNGNSPSNLDNAIYHFNDVQISWRGDSEYFSTINHLPQNHKPNSVNSSSNRYGPKQIRVWEREGCVLHSCAQSPPNLASALVWQPSGALITVATFNEPKTEPESDRQIKVKTEPKKAEVLFFERNGLRRGGFEFLTNEPDEYVRELKWNSNSELLSLVLESSKCNKLQIWNRRNYHWYLKSEWRYEASEKVHALWDAEASMKLLVWSEAGTIKTNHLVWEIACSFHSISSVINSHSILLTPLDQSLLPPPMSTSVVTFHSPLNCIAISSNGGGRRREQKEGEREEEEKKDKDKERSMNGGSNVNVIKHSSLVMESEGLNSIGSVEGGERGEGEGEGEGYGRIVAGVMSDGTLGICELGLEEDWEEDMVMHACDVKSEDEIESGKKVFGNLLGLRHLAWSDPRTLVGIMTLPISTPQLLKSNSKSNSNSNKEGIIMLEKNDDDDVFNEEHGEKDAFMDVFVEIDLKKKMRKAKEEGEEKDSVLWWYEVKYIAVFKKKVTRIVSLSPPSSSPSPSPSPSPSSPSPSPFSNSYQINKFNDWNLALVQTEDGSLWRYHAFSRNKICPFFESLEISMKFSEPCTTMKAERISINGKFKFESEFDFVVFGMSERGNLFAGSHLVHSSSTSFATHCTSHVSATSEKYSTSSDEPRFATHLIFTTKQDTIEVKRLDNILPRHDAATSSVDKMTTVSKTERKDTENSNEEGKMRGKRRNKEDKSNLNDEELNRRPLWEKGAKLITALGKKKKAAIVLQTYRGNLEILWPRGLLMDALAMEIECKNFKKALDMVRRHRLDMNIIVDYMGWQNFVHSIDHFLHQIKNLNHITEFVCALSEKNVVLSQYRGFFALDSEKKKIEMDKEGVDFDNGYNESKVADICFAIREGLEKSMEDSIDREKCILTTLARSRPPLLEEALMRVKRIRDEEINASDSSFSLPESPSLPDGHGFLSEENNSSSSSVIDKNKSRAEDALRHLLWLSEMDEVYNTALGLYDLPLTAMVASLSQKDPKEFFPFLLELENMPPSFMKYKIDHYLKRMDKALLHLSKSGSEYFPKCIELLSHHPFLFPFAFELFEGEKDARKAVMEAWGKHLLEEERYEDAAMAFLSGSFLKSAMDAYRAGGEWRQTFFVASKMGKSMEEMKDLAMEMIEELSAMGKIRDAAQLAVDYLADVEQAVNLMIDARSWKDCVHVACSHGRSDLMDGIIATSALEASREHISDFDESIKKVNNYHSRWMIIREKRLLFASKLNENSFEKKHFGEEGEDDDLASEASSNLSGMSLYTRGEKGSSRTSSSASSANSTASVTGGKRLRRKAAKKAMIGGGKIRAGSPGEEQALIDHIKALVPGVTIREEIGDLAEILTLIGQEIVAKRLQQKLQNLIRMHAKVMEDMHKMENSEKDKVGPVSQIELVKDVRWKWVIFEDKK